ncbi:MAG: hypothetical protein NT004_03010 [Bacteroidetes bacterium]|nr:hypothetical protein [Bacteroidota bacterium]
MFDGKFIEMKGENVTSSAIAIAADDAIREFRASWMNKNIGIVVERCSSSQKNLQGTPCSPIQMVFKGEDDKDKNKNKTIRVTTILRGCLPQMRQI